MQIRVLKFGRNVKTTKSIHIITFPNIFVFLQIYCANMGVVYPPVWQNGINLR